MKFTLCDLVNGPLETFPTRELADEAMDIAINEAITCNLENVGEDMGYATRDEAIIAAIDFYEIIEAV